MIHYGTNTCSCNAGLIETRVGNCCPVCGLVQGVNLIFETPLQSRSYLIEMAEKPRVNTSSRSLKEWRSGLKLTIKNVSTDSERRERRWCMNLDEICQALNLPCIVQRFAWHYFQKIMTKTRVNNAIKILVACIYSSARENLALLSLTDLISVANDFGHSISKRGVIQVYCQFKKYLPRNTVTPYQYLFNIISQIAAEPKVIAAIHGSRRNEDEVFSEVIHKTKRILKNNKIKGMPSIICAAAIYRVMRSMSLEAGSRAFARIINANEASIRTTASKFHS